MDYIEQAGIRIAKPLYDFVNSEALPGTSIGRDAFWSGYAALLADLAPRCKALLAKRDSIQQQIDAWHVANKGKPADADIYMNFLRGIGYVVEEPASVTVTTANVDPEIARIAGPQLVVPVTNARPRAWTASGRARLRASSCSGVHLGGLASNATIDVCGAAASSSVGSRSTRAASSRASALARTT